jgi:methylthioribose-1-phosphate isomerase
MSDAVTLAIINQLGVVFNTLINQVAPILGAVGALGALWVSLRNGQKVKAAATQMAEVKTAVQETNEVAKEAKNATVQLQEGQTFMVKSLETNTLDTNAIREAMAGYISGNSKPGELR